MPSWLISPLPSWHNTAATTLDSQTRHQMLFAITASIFRILFSPRATTSANSLERQPTKHYKTNALFSQCLRCLLQTLPNRSHDECLTFYTRGHTALNHLSSNKFMSPSIFATLVSAPQLCKAKLSGSLSVPSCDYSTVSHWLPSSFNSYWQVLWLSTCKNIEPFHTNTTDTRASFLKHIKP